MPNNHPNRNWRNRWPDEAAAFVRESRKQLGMTQEELAKALDSRSGYRTVQAWESGQNVPPEYLRDAINCLIRTHQAS